MMSAWQVLTKDFSRMLELTALSWSPPWYAPEVCAIHSPALIERIQAALVLEIIFELELLFLAQILDRDHSSLGIPQDTEVVVLPLPSKLVSANETQVEPENLGHILANAKRVCKMDQEDKLSKMESAWKVNAYQDDVDDCACE